MNKIKKLSVAHYVRIHGESLIYRGVLNLENKDLTSLDGFYQLTGAETVRTLYLGLNYLDFNQCSIEAPFSGFTDLKELHLSHNNLTHVPGTLFNYLASLEELELNNNALIALDESLFKGLISLKKLYLAHNQLETLPARLFKDTPLLENLYLGENRLMHLEPTLLYGLTYLKVLSFGHDSPFCLINEHDYCCHEYQCCHGNECCDDEPFDTSGVKNNTLSTLPKEFFKDLSSLASLNLNSMGLRELDSTVFQGLTQLRYLELSNNHLTTLPVDIFKNLTNLEALDLRNNDLTSLDPLIFYNLKNLKWLYLCGNNFSSLSEDIFQPLVSLEWLAIEHNKQTIFDKTLIENITKLKTLRTLLLRKI